MVGTVAGPAPKLRSRPARFAGQQLVPSPPRLVATRWQGRPAGRPVVGASSALLSRN